MSPACWSTLRCLDTPGRLRLKGSASSSTLASPWASRARMAGRVGTARAANVQHTRQNEPEAAEDFGDADELDEGARQGQKGGEHIDGHNELGAAGEEEHEGEDGLEGPEGLGHETNTPSTYSSI